MDFCSFVIVFIRINRIIRVDIDMVVHIIGDICGI